jgi:hypothetical protein
MTDFTATDRYGRSAYVEGANPAAKREGSVCYIPPANEGTFLNVTEATRLRDWLDEQLKAMPKPRYEVQYNGQASVEREMWSVCDSTDGSRQATFSTDDAEARARALAQELNNGDV